MIEIRNENCLDTMEKYLEPKSIDIVLTSPFYNTSRQKGGSLTLENESKNGYASQRYDTMVDTMTDEEYDEFTVELFNDFDRVLSENGVVLYNICYGAENTTGMFTAVNAIITRTNFTIADVIVWKKLAALPNNVSPNKLTRIWEFVFVFCRKDEFETFKCNKKVTTVRGTGQKMYENVFNIIEAANNDELCPFNKATYSTELCEKLLKLYAVDDGRGATVYDPFMGSGTTAVACQRMGFNCYGSEISPNQVNWANERLARFGEKRVEWVDRIFGSGEQMRLDCG